MRILLFDTNYIANQQYHQRLAERGLKLDMALSLEELKEMARAGASLRTFKGLLAHPGREKQEEFMKWLLENKHLRAAVFCSAPIGNYNYKPGPSGLSFFSIQDTDKIYAYFMNQQA
jgi:CRISPR/Cas system-associated endonuclease/helicase Cas3